MDLRTERLRLELPDPDRHAAGYAEALRESWSELGAWLHWAAGRAPPDEPEARDRLAGMRGQSGQQVWMMVLRDSGQVMGRIGLFQIDPSIPKCAMGFWVRSSCTGRGLVTEAARRVKRYAFAELRCERVELRCDSRNTRSAAVARRMGFAHEGTLRSDWRDVRGELNDSDVFSQLRAEHEAAELGVMPRPGLLLRPLARGDAVSDASWVLDSAASVDGAEPAELLAEARRADERVAAGLVVDTEAGEPIGEWAVRPGARDGEAAMSFAVRAEHQRRGVGSAVARGLVARVRAAGWAQRVVCRVPLGGGAGPQEAAERVLRKAGFEGVGGPPEEGVFGLSL